MSHKMIKIMCLPSRYIKRSNNKYVIQDKIRLSRSGGYVLHVYFTAIFPIASMVLFRTFPLSLMKNYSCTEATALD